MTDDGTPAPAPPPPGSTRRRAALIATALSIPVVVLLAFALTAGRGGGSTSGTTAQRTGVLPALTLPPAAVSAADQPACSKVISALPVTLAQYQPRLVRGGGAFVKAWGDPSVVLTCGVARPADLTINSGDFILEVGSAQGHTALWLPKTDSKGTVFTVVDRAVYVQVTMPTAAAAGDVLPLLTGVITSVLPGICTAPPRIRTRPIRAPR